MNNIKSLDEFKIELEDSTIEEKARLPRITKKMKKANVVKSAVTKRVLSENGPARALIIKLFKIIDKEVKKEAQVQHVPYNTINMDTIKLKRIKN